MSKEKLDNATVLEIQVNEDPVNVYGEILTGVGLASKGQNYQAVTIREGMEMAKSSYREGTLPTSTPFYYDRQLRNRRMTVTLHPNARYAGEAWAPFPEEECFDYNILKVGNKINEKYKYRIKPIATAIAGEDFSVNISNSWTDFGRDNQIEGMFNSMKPYAPMIGKLSESMNIINETDKENRKSDGKIAGILGNVSDFIGKYGSRAANLLNRQLTVQGTRFAYFSGTTTSFGNLSMRFTVFSDWIWNGSEYEFTTCYEQLDELYDYAMSKYKPVDGTMAANVSEWVATNVFGASSDTSSKIGQVSREFVEEHIKWQMPPGGFQADLKSVDNVQKGTLKLRINDMYSLENLVITSMQIMFSRIPCKCPTDKDKGKVIPLYADVTLSLQPCTLYSDTALRAFTEGKAWATIGSEKFERELTAKEEAEKYLKKDNIWKKIVAYENGLYDEKEDVIIVEKKK